ncbi:hypothetical protein [Paraburkholderia phosphatilytica]|uniref:hypothetical protein n=1 Tax=Paraburkholderia phosphatilytica TaxID=2282883 RepID=UPI000E4AF49F|nr:hypothetical protein [Paraburkholderia phosphatilytica]
MLRWLIGILILANLVAFGAVRGAFGPLPSSGPREPAHLNRQVRPEMLRVEPLSSADAADQAVVGGPAPSPVVRASTLGQ